MRATRRPWPVSAYIATLVALFVVTAGAEVAYGRLRGTSEAEKAALAQARFAATEAARAVSNAFNLVGAQVQQLALTPGLPEAFERGCSLDFGGAGPFSSGHLDVLRPDGTVACSSLAGQPGRAYAGARWLRRASATPQVFGPFLDPATSRPVVVDAVAVPGGGTVACFLSLEGLGLGLGRLYAGPERLELLVTNPQGTRSLARSLGAARWADASLSGLPFSAAGTAAVRRGVDGRWRTYGEARVAGLGWRVYAGYDQAEAMAPARSTSRDELFIIVVGLLASTGAALTVTRRVTLPMRSLAAAEQARASGRPTPPVEVRRPAELAVLADGFNALVSSVDAELARRQAAEDSYRHLFSNNPAPMWVYDTETLGFLAVNDAAVASYGYSREELLSMTIRDIRPPEDLAALEAAVASAPVIERSGPWRHRKKSGELIDVEVTSHQLTFQGRPARFVMAENITQRRAYERQLREVALRDQLTGLPNRAVVLDYIEQSAAHASARRPMGVVLCGLDRFRDINEAHGHRAGDRVLTEVADRLRSVTGPGQLLGRVGAADFAIVCESLGGETEAIGLAGRVEGVLAAPVLADSQEVFVSASTGIVLADGPRAGEEVLRDALATMHQAKLAGGGRYEVFNAGIRERVTARAELASALHRAVERGELRLHYQPEVELATGQCAGAEALMRWQNPTRGLLGPAQFIALAEETGVIAALGQWALGEACRQAAQWARDQSGPAQVSVNLSPQQLALPDLVSQVTEALDQSGLSPAALCLELTETALMDEADGAMAALAALHDLGVQLSIDDFGTGYSSLLYLRRYPVDYLKVDQAFVGGVGQGAQDTAIVSSVISLAHSLGLKVVAEGVETGAQLEALRQMGCDIAQGYLLGRPVPPGNLAASWPWTGRVAP